MFFGVHKTNVIGRCSMSMPAVLAGALALAPCALVRADSFVALSRLSANGSLDSAFSGDGRLASNLPGIDESANAAVFDANGRFVVAGSVRTAHGQNFMVARYSAAGVLDSTFGTGGVVTTDFPTVGEEASSIALDHSGRIVVAGSAGEQFALARYTMSGALDTSFGSHGLVVTNFAQTDNEYIDALVITPANQIVVAGIAFNGSPGYASMFALARYNADGSLDAHFDGDGKVLTDVTNSDDGASGVVLQADGKILAGGGVAGGKMGVVRYNANGSVDTSYGASGKAIIDFTSMASEGASAMALDSAGRVVLAGSAEDSNFNSFFALARLTPSGALDATFDHDGKVLTDLSGSGEHCAAIKLQSNGKIVVGGSNDSFMRGARYNTDGSLETIFSTINITEKSVDEGRAVLIDSASRIMIIGTTSDPIVIY